MPEVPPFDEPPQREPPLGEPPRKKPPVGEPPRRRSPGRIQTSASRRGALSMADDEFARVQDLAIIISASGGPSDAEIQ